MNIADFESLGCNCEFGFVLRACGDETGSLLRWAEIYQPERLIGLLDGDFGGVFDFDNLVPLNPGMVFDAAAGVGWHSGMRSAIRDPAQPRNMDNLAFTASPAERRAIHALELEKIRYLCGKTRAGLRDRRKIFVFRPPADGAGFDMAVGRAIYAALARRGGRRLLIVTPAGEGDVPGRVVEVQPGLVHGVIDRFAPGENAMDVSLDCWLRICGAAHARLHPTG